MEALFPAHDLVDQELGHKARLRESDPLGVPKCAVDGCL